MTPNATSPQQSDLVTVLLSSKKTSYKSRAESIPKKKKKKDESLQLELASVSLHFTFSSQMMLLHLSGDRPFWCNTEDALCLVLKTVKSSSDLCKGILLSNCRGDGPHKSATPSPYSNINSVVTPWIYINESLKKEPHWTRYLETVSKHILHYTFKHLL